jgi:uncharacterized protein (TIGR03437 family)
VQQAVPALFTANENGHGPAAAIAILQRGDGTQITEFLFDPATPVGYRTALPIDFGLPGDTVYLTLFGTGLRGYPLSDIHASADDGLNLPVLYAGPQGEFEGLDQVNLLLFPQARGNGERGIVITFGGKVTNQVIINTGVEP